ncbi:hypothetical protein [Parabacteroides pacaensis]|nr:hypothetical protein [Parabacteroides pacaensis]
MSKKLTEKIIGFYFNESLFAGICIGKKDDAFILKKREYAKKLVLPYQLS